MPSGLSKSVEYCMQEPKNMLFYNTFIVVNIDHWSTEVISTMIQANKNTGLSDKS